MAMMVSADVKRKAEGRAVVVSVRPIVRVGGIHRICRIHRRRSVVRVATAVVDPLTEAIAPVPARWALHRIIVGWADVYTEAGVGRGGAGGCQGSDSKCTGSHRAKNMKLRHDQNSFWSVLPLKVQLARPKGVPGSDPGVPAVPRCERNF